MYDKITMIIDHAYTKYILYVYRHVVTDLHMSILLIHTDVIADNDGYTWSITKAHTHNT